MEEKVFSTVIGGSLDEFLVLLSSINVNVMNSHKQSLLQASLAYGHNAIAKVVLENGVDVNNQDLDGSTALHYVASHGNLEIAKLLIEHGADPNIEDRFGNNSLWTATFNARGNYEMVKLFLKANGNSTHKNLSGRSAIDFARQIGDGTLVDLLIG